MSRITITIDQHFSGSVETVVTTDNGDDIHPAPALIPGVPVAPATSVATPPVAVASAPRPVRKRPPSKRRR